MACLVIFLVVSSLYIPQAFPLPDPIKFVNNTWNGKFKMGWAEAPKFLPTVDELDSQEQNNRAEFWLLACTYTYIAAVLAGTSIMMISNVRCGIRYDEVPEAGRIDKIPNAQAVQTARISTAVVFFSTYAICLGAVISSLVTNRLSNETGLDWEVYWLLLVANCLWLLTQAVIVVTTTNKQYGCSSFLEASISGTAPFVADSFDTLKDTMFGGLCMQSSSLALKCVGVASLAYLALVHVGLLCYDEYVAEFQSSYLSVLHAPSQLKTSDQQGSADEESANQELPDEESDCFKRVTPILLMILKMCTWSKLKTLMLENCVQAICALLYLEFEGGSPLVVLASLVYPVTHVVIGTIIYRPLAEKMKGNLISKLKQAVLQREVMKVRAESQRLYELLNGTKEILGTMRKVFKGTSDLAFVLSEGFMNDKTLLKLGNSGLDNEDISSLGEALRLNSSLTTLHLNDNKIEDASTTTAMLHVLGMLFAIAQTVSVTSITIRT